MKIAKRIISILSALALSLVMVNGVFAEKFVEPYQDAGSDKVLADEYRQLFEKKTITEDGFEITLPYRLYVPENYDENYAYPVILFLHGAGESGGDNEAQLNVGMMSPFFEKGYYKQFPCIIVAAQVPNSPSGTIGEWVNTSWKDGSYEIKDTERTGPTFTEEIQLAKKAVDQTMADYNVDPDRIYVTGISMGGYGTWNIITHYNKFFAGAMPICGAGDPSKADRLIDMPIWCFHGDEDTAVPVSGSRDMYNALEALGGTKINYTEWTTGGHAWLPAYVREDVWTWLFSQSKTTAEVTDLQSKLDSLKALSTENMDEAALAKYNYAVSFAETVINDKAHTAVNVNKAIEIADGVLGGKTNDPVSGGNGDNNSVIVIVVIGAVALAAVIAVAVLALKKKKA